MVLQMIQQQPAHFCHQWRRQVRPGGKVMGDLPENPRATLGGAPDHDRVGAGVRKNLAGHFRRTDVAVGHHRHLHGGLHRRDGLVLGLARVTLFTRASMHRQHLDAGGLELARQAHRILVLLAPAGPHLERHWDGVRHACRHHRLDDAKRQRFVLHQRRARPLVAHLFGGTTHVDVDDLGAALDVVDSRIGHHLCVGAGDLHRNRTGFPVMVGPTRGLERVPQFAPGGHHLADCIAGAEMAAQLAKRAISHSCHRRDEQVVRQDVGADVHGFEKFRC